MRLLWEALGELKKKKYIYINIVKKIIFHLIYHEQKLRDKLDLDSPSRKFGAGYRLRFCEEKYAISRIMRTDVCVRGVCMLLWIPWEEKHNNGCQIHRLTCRHHPSSLVFLVLGWSPKKIHGPFSFPSFLLLLSYSRLCIPTPRPLFSPRIFLRLSWLDSEIIHSRGTERSPGVVLPIISRDLWIKRWSDEFRRNSYKYHEKTWLILVTLNPHLKDLIKLINNN